MKSNEYIGSVTPNCQDWTVVVVRGGFPPELFTPQPAHDAGFNITEAFGWGHCAASAHQLAASILWEEFGYDSVVKEWNELFVREVISARPRNESFHLTSEQIREWYDEHKSAGTRHAVAAF